MASLQNSLLLPLTVESEFMADPSLLPSITVFFGSHRMFLFWRHVLKCCWKASCKSGLTSCNAPCCFHHSEPFSVSQSLPSRTLSGRRGRDMRGGRGGGGVFLWNKEERLSSFSTVLSQRAASVRSSSTGESRWAAPSDELSKKLSRSCFYFNFQPSVKMFFF